MCCACSPRTLLRGTSKQTKPKPKPFYSDNPSPVKTSISPAQVQQNLLFFLISRICLTKYCCLLSSPPSLEQLPRAFAMQLGPERFALSKQPGLQLPNSTAAGCSQRASDSQPEISQDSKAENTFKLRLVSGSQSCQNHPRSVETAIEFASRRKKDSNMPSDTNC